jgi:hypothetical protein
MKFYANYSHTNDGLMIIKEEDGKFYTAQAYSNGDYQFYEIPYLPKGSVELSSIRNEANHSCQVIKKAPIYKLAKKMIEDSGLFKDFQLKTELDLHENITFTIILKDVKSKDREHGIDLSNLIEDEIEKSNLLPSKFCMVHVVSQEMWDTRRF